MFEGLSRIGRTRRSFPSLSTRPGRGPDSLHRQRGGVRPWHGAVGILLTTSVIIGMAAVPASAVSAPGVSLSKSANVAAYSAAGGVITYTYTVSNTGSSTLTNVTVTDPMAGLSAINCGGNSNVIASLAPFSSQTCTATYTTTANDVQAGSISNVGTVTGMWGPVGATVSATARRGINSNEVT